MNQYKFLVFFFSLPLIYYLSFVYSCHVLSMDIANFDIILCKIYVICKLYVICSSSLTQERNHHVYQFFPKKQMATTVTIWTRISHEDLTKIKSLHQCFLFLNQSQYEWDNVLDYTQKKKKNPKTLILKVLDSEWYHTILYKQFIISDESPECLSCEKI